VPNVVVCVLQLSERVYAVLDLAYPQELQEGFSQPVALLLNESKELIATANDAGYRYFTDVDAFKEYMTREVL
jgi:hypothetical protein